MTVTVELFKAMWCPHCVALIPEWTIFKKMAKKNKDIEITTIEYEDTKNHNEMVEVKNKKGYTFSGFPTIMIQVGSSEPVPYTGPRTAKAIMEYIMQQNEKEQKEQNGGGIVDYELKYYKYKAKYLKSKAN